MSNDSSVYDEFLDLFFDVDDPIVPATPPNTMYSPSGSPDTTPNIAYADTPISVSPISTSSLLSDEQYVSRFGYGMASRPVDPAIGLEHHERTQAAAVSQYTPVQSMYQEGMQLAHQDIDGQSTPETGLIVSPDAAAPPNVMPIKYNSRMDDTPMSQEFAFPDPALTVGSPPSTQWSLLNSQLMSGDSPAFSSQTASSIAGGPSPYNDDLAISMPPMPTSSIPAIENDFEWMDPLYNGYYHDSALSASSLGGSPYRGPEHLEPIYNIDPIVDYHIREVNFAMPFAMLKSPSTHKTSNSLGAGVYNPHFDTPPLNEIKSSVPNPEVGQKFSTENIGADTGEEINHKDITGGRKTSPKTISRFKPFVHNNPAGSALRQGLGCKPASSSPKYEDVDAKHTISRDRLMDGDFVLIRDTPWHSREVLYQRSEFFDIFARALESDPYNFPREDLRKIKRYENCPLPLPGGGRCWGHNRDSQYARHIHIHLPLELGYYYCCPACGEPSRRKDSIDKHVELCAKRNGIPPMLLKKDGRANVFLRLPATEETRQIATSQLRESDRLDSNYGIENPRKLWLPGEGREYERRVKIKMYLVSDKI